MLRDSREPAFQTLNFAGVAHLGYLALVTWKDKTAFAGLGAHLALRALKLNSAVMRDVNTAFPGANHFAVSGYVSRYSINCWKAYAVVKPEIETLGSEVVYKNRWMTVREDTIVRADGSAGLYGVVEKPDFAVIAAVSDGSIYLVEQYRYPVRERFWEFPQGSCGDLTVAPLVLARAQLREETGLIADSMLHAGRLYLAYGYSTQAYDVFLATRLEKSETQLEIEEQGLVARPFELHVVEAMIRNGTIRDATTVAAFGLLRLKKLL